MAKAAPKGGPVSRLEDGPIIRDQKAEVKMTTKVRVEAADEAVLEAVSCKLLARVSPARFDRMLDVVNHAVACIVRDERVLDAWRKFYEAADEAHKAWEPCADCDGTGEGAAYCCAGRDCGCYGRGVSVDCTGCDGRGWHF